MLQLHIERLLKDELIYEINSRSGCVDDSYNVKELYQLLRELSTLEKSENASCSATPADKKSDSDEMPHKAVANVKLFENLRLKDHFDISKWNLKFSGESDELNLNAFLERVDELSEARGITTEKIFKSDVELFEGINFCLTIITISFGLRLKVGLESIEIYVAYMNNFFKRLTIEVDENIKLKIIRNNILPFYQNQLMLTEINLLDYLIDLCRKLEARKVSISNFIPLTRDQNCIEIDLSHNKGAKKKIDNIQIGKPTVTFKDKSYITKNDSSNTGNSRNSSNDRNSNKDSSRDNSRDSSNSRYSVEVDMIIETPIEILTEVKKNHFEKHCRIRVCVIDVENLDTQQSIIPSVIRKTDTETIFRP
ncbi:hypothetical protein FQA39_LY00426 [Lamprigera yunnana]|nr:hypothetical protein FQA39_LY00426 [Lamprigera yunnana]